MERATTVSCHACTAVFDLLTIFGFNPMTVIVIKTERILGTNRKMSKTFGPASEYLVSGITLAPGNLSGHEVCQWRTKGCFGGCVMHYSGQRRFDNSRDRAVRLTNWLFEHRELFEEQLCEDIDRHIAQAKQEDRKPVLRLNAASDLDWMHIISKYPQVQFFDYTKSALRMNRYLAGDLPPNYAITFSASERSKPEQLRDFLELGGNVAMVFDVAYYAQSGLYGALQKTKTIAGKRIKIVDGDTHDVRLPVIDGNGVIVGLRLKGTNESKDRARKFKFAVGK